MKARILVGLAAFLFLFSCSPSSRITHSWISKTIGEKNYNKILVVGLMPNNDRELRENMENHLVGDLTTRGYNAISSLKEYGPKSFENMKEQEAIDTLHTSGVDAVITIVLLDKNKEQYYMPGRVYFSPYFIYHRHFWGYYTTIYNRVYSPGYYQVDTKYFWESNFYNLETKELLYSVQTTSFNPGNTQSLADEYGKLIVADMAKKGIIK